MRWTRALLRLQEIDHALEVMEQQLTEIAAALQENSELTTAEREAQTTAQAVHAARQKQQALEFELEQVQVKRSLTEKALYGGRITNARELQDLQAELQSLTRRISVLEDRLLDAMMASEEADAAAKAAQQRLTDTQARLSKHRNELREKQSQLRASVADLQAERNHLLPQIPNTILETYRYLRDRTGGMPVAQLHGNVCSVCGMEVTKPTQQKVRRGEEAYCGNCGRLLVE